MKEISRGNSGVEIRDTVARESLCESTSAYEPGFDQEQDRTTEAMLTIVRIGNKRWQRVVSPSERCGLM